MTVVYTDDDSDGRDLFTAAINETLPGTRLLYANHGKELLSLLQNADELPDYIFLDINMPVMDGKDCLLKLKTIDHLSEIPVIVYTTTSNKIELQKYIAMGAHAYIVKENSFQGIKNSLKRVLSA